MKIVVTGAGGYIGQRFVGVIRRQGHSIIRAERSVHFESDESIQFDLSESGDFVLPMGVDVVVHLAAITQGADVKSAPVDEVIAARRLVKAAEERGARVVFVSSQTARQDAPTAYGRTKWAIEQLVLAAGGIVVRPGLVYGGPERGLFGRLVGLVQWMPVVPVFFPRPSVQPVHVDDLAEILHRCLDLAAGDGRVLQVGSSRPVPFDEFLTCILEERLGRCRLQLPIPIWLVRLVATCMGSGLQRKVGLDRFVSLCELPLMESLDSLGVSLRPMSEGMGLSGRGRRKRLLQEAYALLHYVLKAPPRGCLLRRYVRAIEALWGRGSVCLPLVYFNLPSLVALLDGALAPKLIGDEMVRRRLDVAVSIVEATTQGAYRMLAIPARGGRLSALRLLVGSLLKECLWSLLMISISPCLRSQLRRMRTG